MLKNSRQRSYIKQLLMNRTDHPTAAMLYQDVREQFPNISLATVYRNLRLMKEMGEIIQVNVGDESEHYDGNIEPHYHHVCKRCGAVNDLMIARIDGITDQAKAQAEHQIDTYELVFHGVCQRCLENPELTGDEK